MHLRGKPGTKSRRPSLRRGATLVELLIALLLLDLSILSLGAVGAVAVRRVGEAGRRNRAAVAAQSRIEQLTAGPCRLATSGSTMLEHGVIERWVSEAIPGGQEISDSISISSRVDESVVLRVRRLC